MRATECAHRDEVRAEHAAAKAALQDKIQQADKLRDDLSEAMRIWVRIPEPYIWGALDLF